MNGCVKHQDDKDIFINQIHNKIDSFKIQCFHLSLFPLLFHLKDTQQLTVAAYIDDTKEEEEQTTCA